MARRSDDVVAEIGAAYLDAPNRGDDALVLAAYAQLQAQTDRLFWAIVRREGRDAVRIVFTRCSQPYSSDRELIAAVRSSHVLEMTSAAISRAPIHALLGCELGGAFDRFRAVHDLIGHVRTGFGFELRDELAAWRAQEPMHSALARRALATEILAVNCAISVGGEAPDHRSLLLDPRLVLRARAWSAAPSRSPASRPGP